MSCGGDAGATADPLWFGAAYEEHHHAVHRVAAMIAGPTIAADVTQDVFLRLWREPDRFDPGRGSLRSLLLAMARGRTIDLIRAESARHAREGRERAQRIRSTGLPVDPLVRSESAAHVRDAVAALPPEIGEAIAIAFFGELTYRETAMVLGQPEGTVKSRIRSGLHRLRVDLDDLAGDRLELLLAST